VESRGKLEAGVFLDFAVAVVLLVPGVPGGNWGDQARWALMALVDLRVRRGRRDPQGAWAPRAERAALGAMARLVFPAFVGDAATREAGGPLVAVERAGVRVLGAFLALRDALASLAVQAKQASAVREGSRALPALPGTMEPRGSLGIEGPRVTGAVKARVELVELGAFQVCLGRGDLAVSLASKASAGSVEFAANKASLIVLSRAR